MNTRFFSARSAFAWFFPLLILFLASSGPGPAGAASPHSSMSQNKVPGQVESTARRLANGLRQQGYEVSRGYFKLYTQDDCPASLDVLGSCLGNNPAAPYIIPVMPVWPDEWVDPGTAGLLPGLSAGAESGADFKPGVAQATALTERGMCAAQRAARSQGWL